MSQQVEEKDRCLNCVFYRGSGPHKHDNDGPKKGDGILTHITCKKHGGLVTLCKGDACTAYKRATLAA